MSFRFDSFPDPEGLCLKPCFKASIFKTFYLYGMGNLVFLNLCVCVCVFLLCLQKSNFLLKYMFSPSQSQTSMNLPWGVGAKVSGTD